MLTAAAAAEPLGLDRPLHKQAEQLLHVDLARRRAPARPIVRRRPAAPSSRGRRAQELQTSRRVLTRETFRLMEWRKVELGRDARR